MLKVVNPGDGILFMKVGTHAQESLDDIIARKSKEIADAGFAMWGYGGNTCHPTSMVQPFAEQYIESILGCLQMSIQHHTHLCSYNQELHLFVH